MIKSHLDPIRIKESFMSSFEWFYTVKYADETPRIKGMNDKELLIFYTLKLYKKSMISRGQND